MRATVICYIRFSTVAGERGDYPRWTMYVQIITEEQPKNHYENPFDIAKILRHREFPLHEVDVLALNRNPENYFVEVEQAAFPPAHVVSGSGFSPDKFLQRRLFVYGDAPAYSPNSQGGWAAQPKTSSP